MIFRVLLLTLFGTAAIPLQSASGQATHSMKMAQPKQSCSISKGHRDAMLSAGYASFDQSMADDSLSWRPLLNVGCYRLASTLIDSYLEQHAASLDREQTRTLHFHSGQTLAMGGEEHASISHFELSPDPAMSPEWNAYVDATLAFLKKDRSRLEAARASYAAAANASSDRLQFIDGFLACFTKSYTEAVMCGRK